jgi:hypothetical protein
MAVSEREAGVKFMTAWAPIRYMGFWDVPRIFLTRYKGQAFLFDCPFDEELEDDSDSYRVYMMPDLAEEDLPKDWTTLHQRATRFIGEIPVARVCFDSTRRREVELSVLEELLTPTKAKP